MVGLEAVDGGAAHDDVESGQEVIIDANPESLTVDIVVVYYVPERAKIDKRSSQKEWAFGRFLPPCFK